jgi:hypothetical protein
VLGGVWSLSTASAQKAQAGDGRKIDASETANCSFLLTARLFILRIARKRCSIRDPFRVIGALPPSKMPAEPVTSRVQNYRHRAEELRALANSVTTEVAKVSLLHTAMAYDHLADAIGEPRAERRSPSNV